MNLFKKVVARLVGKEFIPRPQPLVERSIAEAKHETALADEREAEQLDRVRRQTQEAQARHKEEETIDTSNL